VAFAKVVTKTLPLDLVLIMNKDSNSNQDGILRIASKNETSQGAIAKWDVNDLIKHCKDMGFDLIAEISHRPDNFTWGCARAIDADKPNDNGDYFSTEEILKKVDAGKKRGKIPAYKTFETVPVYTNHENDNVLVQKGRVVFAWWDEKEKCVYTIFYVDTEAWPDLARGIEQRYIIDVSMGCVVEESECSICGNKAKLAKDFCDHVKSHKGRKFTGYINSGPKKGKYAKDELVFEYNFGVRFIELSCVADGAYRDCEIEMVIPVREVLENANSLKQTAKRLSSAAKKGLTYEHIHVNDDLRNSCVDALNTSETMMRAANSNIERMTRYAQAGAFPKLPGTEDNPWQTPDRLTSKPVAGEIHAPPDSGNDSGGNATPAPPMGGAQGGTPAFDDSPPTYTDPIQALSGIVDQYEAIIGTMLRLKHEINMEHVRDIAKQMAEAQQKIGDMIDDGIGNYGNLNIPVTPQGMGGGAAGAANPQGGANAPSGEYQPTPEGVGVQLGANAPAPATPPVPGAAPPTASSNHTRRVEALRSLNELQEKMEATHKLLTSSSAGNTFVRNSSKEKSVIMNDFGATVADTWEEKIAANKGTTIIEHSGPYRIAVSSIDGTIKGYHEDREFDLSDDITEEDVEMMRAGHDDVVVAKFFSILKEAATVKDSARVRTAMTQNDVAEKRLGQDSPSWPSGRLGYPNEVQEQYLDNARKGSEDKTQEERLMKARTGADDTQGELRLKDHRVGADTEVNERRVMPVQEGNDDRVTEQRLSPKRAGTADGRVVAAAVDRALARATVDAKISPQETLDIATRLASNDTFTYSVDEYSLPQHKEARVNLRRKAEFYGPMTATNVSAESHVLAALADEVTDEISPSDLSVAIHLVASSGVSDKYAEVIGDKAKEILENNNYIEVAVPFTATAGREADIKKSILRTAFSKDTERDLSRQTVLAAVNALAQTVNEFKISDEEILTAFGSVDTDTIAADISDARTASSAQARAKLRARYDYWKQFKGASINVDSNDTYSYTIGTIGDIAEAQDLNTLAVAEAIHLFASEKPAALKAAIRTAINKMNKVEAACINDRSERVLSIEFTLSECGATKDDPQIERRVKEYVVELLGRRGYELADANSLSFTNLCVTSDGIVTAELRSTVCRSFNDNEPREMLDVLVGQPSRYASNLVSSDGAMQIRQAQRKIIAQAAGGAMAGEGFGNGGAMAGGGEGGPGGAMGDMGLASLGGGSITPPDGEAPGDMETDAEGAMNKPGQIMPPGTICPACGSIDVEFGEGHGNCKSCSTEFSVKFSIDILNPKDFAEKGDETSDKMDEEASPAPGDIAGEAPAAPPEAGADVPGGVPGAVAGGPAGGGSPQPPMASSHLDRLVRVAAELPVPVEISWLGDPEDYLKIADGIANRYAAKAPYPPGFVCPVCTNHKDLQRVAEKSQSICYCDDCGTRMVITASRVGNKINNVIRYNL